MATNRYTGKSANHVDMSGTEASTARDIDPNNDPILPHHNSDTGNTNEKQWIKGNMKEHRRFHPLKFIRISMKSTSKLSSFSNILLPLIPIGIALHYARKDLGTATFVTNYLAMIPAANMLAFASAEIALKLPLTFGATFETLMGAVVELIVCILLMLKGQITVVQAALLGSMLANLLLVSGACFVAGGILYQHQELAEYVTEVSGAGLLVSAIGLIIPTQFASAVRVLGTVPETELAGKLLHISRLMAIGLLVSYAALLFFQLKTHNTVFDAALQAAEERDADGHKEHKREKLSLLEAFILLALSLAAVTLCAIFLIEQIPHIVEGGHVSDAFMGLILVPLVEKAAEHLTAIDEAWDNQMDLALSHCLGATIQTALLVAPVVVIVGWGANKNMDLNFDYVWAFMLVLSVLVVGNFVRDRKTNWLEGGFLLMVYYGIAVAAWYFPNPIESGTGTEETGGEAAPSGEATGTESASMTSEVVGAATEAAIRMLVRALN